jgi:hypothetical protein
MKTKLFLSLILVFLIFGSAYGQDDVKQYFLSGANIVAGHKLIYAGRFDVDCIYAIYEPLEEGQKCKVFAGPADNFMEVEVFSFYRDGKHRLVDMSDLFFTKIGKFRFPPDWMRKIGSKAILTNHLHELNLDEIVINGKPKVN